MSKNQPLRTFKIDKKTQSRADKNTFPSYCRDKIECSICSPKCTQNTLLDERSPASSGINKIAHIRSTSMLFGKFLQINDFTYLLGPQVRPIKHACAGP